MEDLRRYRPNVKAAITKERRDDPLWNWSIDEINRKVIRIGWGYFQRIGEKDGFIITCTEDKAYGKAVVGSMPNGKKIYCTIGCEPWSECKTMEEAIEWLIHALAVKAKTEYHT